MMINYQMLIIGSPNAARNNFVQLPTIINPSQKRAGGQIKLENHSAAAEKH